jgi:hypothetical protein
MELLPFSSPDEFPTPRNLSAYFSGLNGFSLPQIQRRCTAQRINPQAIPPSDACWRYDGESCSVGGFRLDNVSECFCILHWHH